MKSEINPPLRAHLLPLAWRQLLIAWRNFCLPQLVRKIDQVTRNLKVTDHQKVNLKLTLSVGRMRRGSEELKSLISLVRNFPCRFEDKSLGIKNAQSRAVETPPTRLLIKPLSLPTRVKLFPYFDFTPSVSILLFRLLLPLNFPHLNLSCLGPFPLDLHRLAARFLSPQMIALLHVVFMK